VRILLFGASGQVGSQLRKILSPLETIRVCNRKEADLENAEQLKK